MDLGAQRKSHFDSDSALTRVVPLQLLNCSSSIPLHPSKAAWVVERNKRRLSVVEKLESVAWADLQRAARFCKSILQKAFTVALITKNE